MNHIRRRLFSTLNLPPTIRQLLSSTGIHSQPTDNTPVTVHGWVKSIRRQKNISFAVISDGSSPAGLQAVFPSGSHEIHQASKALTNGASVRLVGKLVSSPGQGQEKELLVENMTVLGTCDPEQYPIQKQTLSTEFLRDNMHLRARTERIASMIRLRDFLRQQISGYFNSQGFSFANTPILTGNDAEGGGEAFRLATREPPSTVTSTPPSIVDASQLSPLPSFSSSPATGDDEFFSRPAYLTVSHQLHLEALATSLSRVYTLSPCFRAERSQTGRHLAEFWMLEAEWAFPRPENPLAETCDVVEACLRTIAANLVVAPPGGKGTKDDFAWQQQQDLRVLWKDGDISRKQSLEDAFSSTRPWARISYDDAVKELETHHALHPHSFEYPPKWGKPLQSEHEKWIAEKWIKGPVFVQNYPAMLKPFYMRANEDGKTVGCFDLLIPYVGELVGGSVREERYDVLREKMAAAGFGSEYEWYQDLRKYGGAPHVGFGMGFERLVGWIGGIDNVRECVPIPRWADRMVL